MFSDRSIKKATREKPEVLMSEQDTGVSDNRPSDRCFDHIADMRNKPWIDNFRKPSTRQKMLRRNPKYIYRPRRRHRRRRENRREPRTLYVEDVANKFFMTPTMRASNVCVGTAAYEDSKPAKTQSSMESLTFEKPVEKNPTVDKAPSATPTNKRSKSERVHLIYSKGRSLIQSESLVPIHKAINRVTSYSSFVKPTDVA